MPLITAWSTTIHKFQGFEAGHDDTDRFKYLIIDPGNRTWETKNCGGLYVALSRGKELSNIYWINDGMCRSRITMGAYRKDGTLCELYKKRQHWVNYLKKRQERSPSIFTSAEVLRSINKTIATKAFTSDEIRKQIRTIMKEPQWQRQKNYLVNACLFEETEAR